MPKNKSALTRYRIIDRCLRNTMRPYPTKEYIREKIQFELFGDLGNTVSVSSIEKDFDAMRHDASLGYNAPIAYDRIRKGYYYATPGYSIDQLPLSPEEEDALVFAAKTLHQYRDIAIFDHFKDAIEKIYARISLHRRPFDQDSYEPIQFEKPLGHSGSEWLQPLYHAIVHHHAITLTYKNIYKGQTKTHHLVPYLLKENRNKWYLVSYFEKYDNYMVLALDRIQDLQVHIDSRFEKSKDFKPEEQFKHSTGIMSGTGTPSRVVMQVREPISEILRLNPIHPSLYIEEDLNNGFRCSMQVIISPELIHQLLSFGKYLTILSPETLRAELREQISDMYQLYE